MQNIKLPDSCELKDGFQVVEKPGFQSVDDVTIVCMGCSEHCNIKAKQINTCNYSVAIGDKKLDDVEESRMGLVLNKAQRIAKNCAKFGQRD